jgi:hypothetical protein
MGNMQAFFMPNTIFFVIPKLLKRPVPAYFDHFSFSAALCFLSRLRLSPYLFKTGGSIFLNLFGYSHGLGLSPVS